MPPRLGIAIDCITSAPRPCGGAWRAGFGFPPSGLDELGQLFVGRLGHEQQKLVKEAGLSTSLCDQEMTWFWTPATPASSPAGSHHRSGAQTSERPARRPTYLQRSLAQIVAEQCKPLRSAESLRAPWEAPRIFRLAATFGGVWRSRETAHGLRSRRHLCFCARRSWVAASNPAAP
jgi:hypothetical protein